MKARIAGMIVALAASTLVGCKEDPIDTEPTNEVVVPTTYSFSNVNFAGQTDRLLQLDELVAYLETANTAGVALDAQKLNDMFANTNGNGGGNFSFSSTRDLKSKCFELSVSDVEALFAEAETASQSTQAASNGTAGVMYNADSTRSRLFSASGMEYAELVEKAMMGAVFYYQATSIYMSDSKMDVDNATVTEGEGTAMQHHWDEAYGYFGATVDFPTDQENVNYWAKYCVSRDAALNCIETIGYAFRKGRAAIGKGNYEVRDSAITETRAAWEQLCAGLAIHYLNSAITNIGDDYSRNHALSEGWAFVDNLLYNEGRTITTTEIDAVKAKIGDNFYEVTESDLTAARDQLASIFGLEAIKTIL
jgi:hypothetical protein